MKQIIKDLYYEGRKLGYKGKVLNSWVDEQLEDEEDDNGDDDDLETAVVGAVKKRGRPKKYASSIRIQ